MIRRSIICLSALLVALTLATSTTTRAAAQARQQPPVTEGVPFKIVSPDGLVALSAATGDRRFGRVRRRLVTDMRLVLSHGHGGLARALRLANGLRPTRHGALFRAEILAVSGGRLLAGGIAWCGPWTDDRSLCEADCDGGAFEIVRNDDAMRFALVIDAARLLQTGRNGGILIPSCADPSDAGSVRLEQSDAGRPVHLLFAPDRRGSD